MPGCAPTGARHGIVVYGSAPDYPENTGRPLGPAAHHDAIDPAAGHQQLQAGDTVGYGSRFTAEGPLTIGVAACGYADGYPRHCDTGTRCW